jgi:hypothetical protein
MNAYDTKILSPSRMNTPKAYKNVGSATAPTSGRRSRLPCDVDGNVRTGVFSQE